MNIKADDINRYLAMLGTLESPLEHGRPLPPGLEMAREGRLSVHYAPFDPFNVDARIVLVGITPGLQQAVNALNATRAALQAGRPVADAVRAGKATASFSGPMRRSLVAMLDFIGIQRWLGLGSCAALFGSHGHLLHATSALRYPVFLDGDNYNGTPAILRTPLLSGMVGSMLSRELRQLPDAVVVPLGPKVATVVQHLAQQGVVDPERILDGLPHPSGANMERISYFLGQKDRDALSGKTNAAKIDASRSTLLDRVARLVAAPC